MNVATGARTSGSIGARQIVIVALSSAIYAVLGIAAATFSLAPGGISVFYFPAIFIYPAAMWFGVWGVLGAFFGSILFSPFFGYGFLVGVIYGVVDMISPAAVGILTRVFRVEPRIPTGRDYLLFALTVLIGASIEAVIGGVVTNGVGLISPDAIPFTSFVWWTGEITAGWLLAPILLRVLTPYFQRTGLYHPKFLSAQTGSSIIEG